MTIWAVTMVRDEEDVIVGTCQHLLAQGVDHVLVADNLSRDRTRERLGELARTAPVTVIDDPDPAYRQGEKMTALAHRAGEQGATWIVPFDADELWGTTDGRTLREVLASVDADELHAEVFDYRPSLLPVGSPFRRMRHRKPEPSFWGKVAFRYAPGLRIEDGNHAVSGREMHRVTGLLIVRHFPYRSLLQFRRKVRQGTAAVLAADKPAEMAGHWKGYARRSDLTLLLTWLRMCVRGGYVRDPV